MYYVLHFLKIFSFSYYTITLYTIFNIHCVYLLYTTYLLKNRLIIPQHNYGTWPSWLILTKNGVLNRKSVFIAWVEITARITAFEKNLLKYNALYFLLYKNSGTGSNLYPQFVKICRHFPFFDVLKSIYI